jgi:hypothetical protein
VTGKMKKGRHLGSPLKHHDSLAMILVTFFPVALVVPAMIGTPIAVVLAPAAFSLFVKFMAGMFRLAAAFAMSFDGTIQAGFVFFHAFATFAMIVVGAKLGCAGEQKHGSHGRDCRRHTQSFS